MRVLHKDFNPRIAGLTVSQRNSSAIKPYDGNLRRNLIIDNHYIYTEDIIERMLMTRKDPRKNPEIFSDLVFVKVCGRNVRDIEKELVDLAGNSKERMPFTEFLTRYVSAFLTKYLWLRLPIRPEIICFMSLLLIIAGSVSFLYNLWIALGLIILGFVFDCCDGEVARVKLQNTAYGAWLDSTFDRVGETFMILLIALSFGISFTDLGLFMGFFCLSGVFMVHLTGAYVPVKFKQQHPTGFKKFLRKRIDWFDFGRSTQVFMFPILLILTGAFFTLLIMGVLNHLYWAQRVVRYIKLLA